ncbi:MAG: chemotaxis protein CheW [Euryarchaeota archaeon]|nr:chemotaxis protein CheW [Euryarchaeota archaeon]
MVDIQLVVFRLGREEYAADIGQVREIILPGAVTPVPRSPPFVEGVINLRGQITTVVDLRKRLGLPAQAPGKEARILIADLPSGSIGFLVDAVAEVRRLPMEAISPPSPVASGGAASPFLRGIGRAENRLLILLDLAQVVATEEAAAA